MNARLKKHLEQSSTDDDMFEGFGMGAGLPVLFGAGSKQSLSQLSMSSSRQMKGFSGLKEGLERLGGNRLGIGKLHASCGDIVRVCKVAKTFVWIFFHCERAIM